MAYDRSLIVADPRRCEPKKFGGWKAKIQFKVYEIVRHYTFHFEFADLIDCDGLGFYTH